MDGLLWLQKSQIAVQPFLCLAGATVRLESTIVAINTPPECFPLQTPPSVRTQGGIEPA